MTARLLWPPSTAAALNSLAGEDVALSVSRRTISFFTLHGRTVLMPESCESPSLSALYGRFQEVGAMEQKRFVRGFSILYLNIPQSGKGILMFQLSALLQPEAETAWSARSDSVFFCNLDKETLLRLYDFVDQGRSP